MGASDMNDEKLEENAIAAVVEELEPQAVKIPRG